MSATSQSPNNELTPRQIWIVLGSLMIGTVLSALDGTIVSTALPTIAGKLHGFSQYAWVGTAYILASTISTPILGKLGDLFGRRKVMLSVIVVFLLGSLLCGLAQNMTQLIAARAVQGLGGGGIQALTFAILGDLVSPRERGRYMGVYTGIFAFSAVVGPLVGGWMIDSFDWRWIFLFNVPVAIIAFLAISATLHIPFVQRKVRIDWIGAALLSLSLGTLVIGLDRGRKDWSNPSVLMLLAVAAAAMVLFIAQERRAPEPIIPLRLFSNKVFRIASSMGFVAGALAYGAQSFLPLQFQDANFVSPTRAGLYLAPVMAGVMFGSAYGGRFIAATGRYKALPIIALVLGTLGALAISRITASTRLFVLALPMVAIGLGNGTTFTTTSIATQNAISPTDIGVGTASLLSIRALGGSLGLALFGTLFTSTVEANLTANLPAGSLPAGKPVSSLLREPATIQALAKPVRQVVVQSISEGTGKVFLFASGVAAVGVVLALILPELPLRTTVSQASSLE